MQIHLFLYDFPWLDSSHFNHQNATALVILLCCYFLLFRTVPSLMKSPEHPWAVWFPCFHAVLTAGLQRPVAITGLSTAPAVVIAHKAGTTGLGRSCSQTNQMQTLHGDTLKCNAQCVTGSHRLLRHQRTAIRIYPGCRNTVTGTIVWFDMLLT